MADIFDTYKKDGDKQGDIFDSYKPKVSAEQKEPPPPATETQGFFGKIGEDINKRVKNVTDSKASWYAQPYNVVGQTAGFAGDVIGQSISSAAQTITPDKAQDYIKEKMKSLFQTSVGQSGLRALQTGGKIYDKFKEDHPDIASNLEATANLLMLTPGGKAGKATKELGEGVVKTATEKGTQFVEKKLAQQKFQETLDMVKPELSILSKKQREGVLTSGRVEKPSVFKKAEIKVNKQDIEIANSINGIVEKGKNPIENIDKIRTEIGKVAEQTAALPKELDKPLNEQEMNELLKRFAQAKEDSSVIFASDKSLENAYDSIGQEFAKIIGDKPPTLSNLLDGRKKLDQIIKQKFPTIFSKFSGDNIRANAVKDIRMAVNDFIADSLPEGNQFKALLQKQTNMYRAMDRIAEKSAPALDQSSIQRITSVFKKHPWLSLEAGGYLAGLGALSMGVGGAIADIVTSPAMIAGMVLYGSARVGKMVITSKMMKEGIINILKNPKTTLAKTERVALQNLVRALPDVPEQSSEKESPSDKTESQQPEGFQDTGKTSGGKKVYSDGKGNAWIAP